MASGLTTWKPRARANVSSGVSRCAPSDSGARSASPSWTGWRRRAAPPRFAGEWRLLAARGAAHPDYGPKASTMRRSRRRAPPRPEQRRTRRLRRSRARTAHGARCALHRQPAPNRRGARRLGEGHGDDSRPSGRGERRQAPRTSLRHGCIARPTSERVCAGRPRLQLRPRTLWCSPWVGQAASTVLFRPLRHPRRRPSRSRRPPRRALGGADGAEPGAGARRRRARPPPARAPGGHLGGSSRSAGSRRSTSASFPPPRGGSPRTATPSSPTSDSPGPTRSSSRASDRSRRCPRSCGSATSATSGSWAEERVHATGESLADGRQDAPGARRSRGA